MTSIGKGAAPTQILIFFSCPNTTFRRIRHGYRNRSIVLIVIIIIITITFLHECGSALVSYSISWLRVYKGLQQTCARKKNRLSQIYKTWTNQSGTLIKHIGQKRGSRVCFIRCGFVILSTQQWLRFPSQPPWKCFERGVENSCLREKMLESKNRMWIEPRDFLFDGYNRMEISEIVRCCWRHCSNQPNSIER